MKQLKGIKMALRQMTAELLTVRLEFSARIGSSDLFEREYKPRTDSKYRVTQSVAIKFIKSVQMHLLIALEILIDHDLILDLITSFRSKHRVKNCRPYKSCVARGLAKAVLGLVSTTRLRLLENFVWLIRWVRIYAPSCPSSVFALFLGFYP